MIGDGKYERFEIHSWCITIKKGGMGIKRSIADEENYFTRGRNYL